MSNLDRLTYRTGSLQFIVYIIYFLLVLGCVYNVLGSAQEDTNTPPTYLCRKTTKPLSSLDGKANKAFWEQAEWTTYFNDIEGDRKPKPKHQTRAKMLWDDQNFYVMVEMEEPHLWATYDKHDSVIYHENDIELFIDPDHDSLNYYEFEMNALNTTWDLLMTKPYRDGGTYINSWEMEGLKTAVHLDGTINNPADIDRGWSVEIVIPWKALADYSKVPSPPKTDDEWRVNFSRVQWDREVKDGQYAKIKGKPEHNWTWVAQGVIDMHIPDRWGYVRFVDERLAMKKSEGSKEVKNN